MDFTPDIFMWHFTATALFMLCLISGIISYHSREKSFKYYAFYSFFLLLYLFFKSPYEIPFLISMYESRFSSLNWYVQVIYNCIYFLFFISFLDVKVYHLKVYTFIRRVVGIAFTISTLLFLGTLISNSVHIFAVFFKYLFTPVMFLFGLYAAVWAFTVPGKLKYYIVIGSIIFASLAVTALFARQTSAFDTIVYFYFGIFIEQIAFGFGLAYKVRKINNSLLYHLTENEKIKSNQNIILQQELQKKEIEIMEISTKAEEQRVLKLKSKFENEINQLHLLSLQSQMNPHFIFNALNSIKVFLIENNKEQAIFYLNKFAKLIRKILDSSRQGSVTLKEELETIQLYMGIENIRFDNQVKIIVHTDVGIDLDNTKVPPLILQPFVENAIWHGLMLSEKEKIIEINIYKEENFPMLSLKDNGIGRVRSQENKLKKSFKKKSLGLKMTNERLEHFNYKERLKYSFRIIDLFDDDHQSIGTEVRFSFVK